MKRNLLALCLAVAGSLAAAGCGRSFVPATPPGFVDLGDTYPDGEYRATTADGAVLGVRAFANEPRGELAFWARALENRMRENGGYALLTKQAITSRGGLVGTELDFGHDEGSTPHLYRVALFSRGCLAPAAADLGHGDAVGELHQRAQQRQWLHPQRILIVDQRQQSLRIAFQQGSEKVPQCAAISQAQHVAHALCRNPAAAFKIGMGDGLIQDRKPVPHRTFSRSRDHG